MLYFGIQLFLVALCYNCQSQYISSHLKRLLHFLIIYIPLFICIIIVYGNKKLTLQSQFEKTAHIVLYLFAHFSHKSQAADAISELSKEGSTSHSASTTAQVPVARVSTPQVRKPAPRKRVFK